jgi:hypothetical protein
VGSNLLRTKETQAQIASMLRVLETWKGCFAAHGVGQESLRMQEGAMLPASFRLRPSPSALSYRIDWMRGHGMLRRPLGLFAANTVSL